jgi:hypothetical protein
MATVETSEKGKVASRELMSGNEAVARGAFERGRAIKLETVSA